MHIHFVLTCFFLLIETIICLAQDDLGEVIFVNILFRHGDRTPVKTYPNDPYRNNSLWPARWGELTDAGKKGHYELGKFLRKRYAKLIPDKYDRDAIFIQSTDVDRTLMSACSNLAGLFEPNLTSNWSPDIKWQPIPVHTIPETSDWVLVAKKPCPRYESAFQALLDSDEIKNKNKAYDDLYKYLSSNTGNNVTSIRDVESLYSNLFIEDHFKFELPNWTSSVYPDPMKGISEFSFSMPCHNPTLAKYKSGPLIGEMLRHMKQKSQRKLRPNRKAWMYSAHDTTVANFLNALNVFSLHNPPYLSLILLELRVKDSKHYVTLFYQNSTTVGPMLLTIPGCEGSLCSLETFEKVVKPIVPLDWEKECHDITRFIFGPYSTLSGISFITSASVAAIFLVGILLVLRVYKKRYYSHKEVLYHSLKMDMQA